VRGRDAESVLNGDFDAARGRCPEQAYWMLP